MENEINISLEDAKQMVGQGWSKILEDLYENFSYSVKVTCVKEKYGVLRVYIDYGNDIDWHFIDQAELESSVTCEKCGKPGKLRPERSWLLTLCDSCHTSTTMLPPHS